MANMSQRAKPQFGNRAGPALRQASGRAAAAKPPAGPASNYSMTAIVEEQGKQRNLLLVIAAVVCAALGWIYFSVFNEESINGKIITSAEECASFGSVGIDNCTEMWTRSAKIHADTAPAYPQREQCEQIHGAGRCIQAERSKVAARQTRFIPAMAAFVATRTPAGDIALSPLYRNPGDGPDQWRKVGPPVEKS